MRKRKLHNNKTMSLVTIKTFSDSYEANICKGRLEAEGIKCFIKNESFIAANPLLSLAAGNYQLQINEKDAEKVLKILGDK